MNLSDHIAVMDAVYAERQRQEILKLQGKFRWSCADIWNDPKTRIPDSEKLAVLAEEFGEVARLVAESVISINRRNPQELKRELVQVAAVAVAWIEAIEREEKNA